MAEIGFPKFCETSLCQVSGSVIVVRDNCRDNWWPFERILSLILKEQNFVSIGIVLLTLKVLIQWMCSKSDGTHSVPSWDLQVSATVALLWSQGSRDGLGRLKTDTGRQIGKKLDWIPLTDSLFWLLGQPPIWMFWHWMNRYWRGQTVAR